MHLHFLMYLQTQHCDHRVHAPVPCHMQTKSELYLVSVIVTFLRCPPLSHFQFGVRRCHILTQFAIVTCCCSSPLSHSIVVRPCNIYSAVRHCHMLVQPAILTFVCRPSWSHEFAVRHCHVCLQSGIVTFRLQSAILKFACSPLWSHMLAVRHCHICMHSPIVAY